MMIETPICELTEVRVASAAAVRTTTEFRVTTPAIHSHCQGLAVGYGLAAVSFGQQVPVSKDWFIPYVPCLSMSQNLAAVGEGIELGDLRS
ncbi:hypothetical protein J6590_034545 [Homalodisca vitripennis]|nr:hypothetical protein J6590_034545 [Homalodisca vitripennis]